MIPLGPKAQAILEPFLGRPDACYCFSPAEAEAERNAARRESRKTKRWKSHIHHQARKKAMVENRPAMERYTPDSLRRAITRATPSGATPWFPYQLRHSAGTLLARRFGKAVAGEVLGHRDARVTERYVDPDLGVIASAMVEVG